MKHEKKSRWYASYSFADDDEVEHKPQLVNISRNFLSSIQLYIAYPTTDFYLASIDCTSSHSNFICVYVQCEMEF